MMNCSDLDTANNRYVGPSEVFASIGHWSTSVYIILALHAIPVWIFSSHIRLAMRSSSTAASTPYLAWLVSGPPALMFLASVGILIPSLGIFVEVLLEIVIVVSMLKYIQFILSRVGGAQELVTKCNQENVRLPLGAPPFVCMVPCAGPKMTVRSLNFVLLTPVLLLLIKLIILSVEVVFLLIGYNPDRQFFSVDNIHNLSAVPVGLLGIYGYNMFLIIITKFLPEKSDSVMGLVVLVLFVLFDCTRMFFVFLTGTGMQTCVPPFMTVDIVSHFLKNCIKGFLGTFIGVPFLAICKDKITLPQQTPNLVTWTDSEQEDLPGGDQRRRGGHRHGGAEKHEGGGHVDHEHDNHAHSNSVPDLQRSI